MLKKMTTKNDFYDISKYNILSNIIITVFINMRRVSVQFRLRLRLFAARVEHPVVQHLKTWMLHLSVYCLHSIIRSMYIVCINTVVK